MVGHYALFLYWQTSDACLWSVLGEWVRCVFLGVLPWAEVCHYLVLVLLLGPDFTIYFLVALVRHLQGPITRQARSHKAVLHLQVGHQLQDTYFRDTNTTYICVEQ